MPLDTALNLLRDKDDNIELEVPVTGDISSPQFSFMSIINKAIIKATGTTAISYLKYVLGPYGLAIGATEIGYKMASGIRLEPIAFKAGSSVIEPENNAYLEKVTQILKDRKKVRITFCGWAVEQDRAVFQKYLDLSTRKGIIADDSKNAEEVEQKLLSLAEARAHALEKYLVEKHGIDHKRILICRPQIDPEIEAQPRVRLVI